MWGVTRRLPGGPRGRGGIFLLSLWDRMVVGTHCIPRLPLGTIIIYVHPCTHLYIPCGRPSDACRECTGGVYRPQYQGGHPQHPVAVRIELYRNVQLRMLRVVVSIGGAKQDNSKAALHLTPLAPCATFRPWAYRPQGATTWTTGTIPQSPACNSPNINGRASADIES